MSPSAIAESSDMATQSTFSYAQAAKGQGTTPASNNAVSTDAAAPAPDAQVPVATSDAAAPVADAKTVAPAAEQTDAFEAPERTEPRAAAPEKQDFESVPGSESDARSESTQSRRTESRRDDDSSRLERPWRRNDKTPRSSSNATGSVDEQDSRKARRSKKGKTSEKQSSEQTADKEQEATPEPKIELSEAPIPSVNIWHQRKEAQQAKSTKPAPTPVEATVNGTAAQKADEKSLGKAAEESTSTPHTNGVKSQQKPTSATRPERNGPRGSRITEKDGKSEVPPSVEDSTAWPTPETAITAIKDDIKKKTVEKTPERSDRSDKDSQEDGSSSKPRQKWVTYDYVPTVSFETQLPQMRGSKPRGGARSGRDGAARATTNGIADKAASTAPGNKSNDVKPRDVTNNAASQSSAAKRGSVDAASQKKASANIGSDKTRDSPAQPSETSQTSRDRPEGRGERARGGYRGRGAHHGNAQGQHQHSASASGFHGQGAGASRAQGYSPPLRQGGHGGIFAPPTQRGRGNRNGANNFHRISLPNGSSRMPAVQAQFPPYDYSMAPMAGIPFQPNPYWDNMLVPVLKSQIEYYFSIENLCKDMYLRRHMDSQGFVPLHFITAFKRMQELSADMNFVRAVCEDSIEVDYVVGDDDGERLRRREGWQKFVLPMDERDELARNKGPLHLTFKNRAYNYPNGQFNGIPPMPYGTPAYPHDPSFQQYVPQDVNGVVPNGTTQLSAEVPDFSPSGTVPLVGPKGEPQVAPVEALVNGHIEKAAPLTNGVHVGEAQTSSS
ncbi:hypothetical protein F66182_9262 [Fusarium sp. NRRL 66182]|nr:hypothetical protein F66182_9262 [Fusarium sp. NRRL 66182]